MFVDAAHEFCQISKGRRALREEDMDKIIAYYKEFSDQYDLLREGLASARVIDTDKILKSDSSLYVKRFVDISPINVQVTRLTKQYKEYEMFPLKDIVIEVNSTGAKGCFDDKDNSLYIPNSGSHGSACDAKEFSVSPKNTYQLIFDENIVLNMWRFF